MISVLLFGRLGDMRDRAELQVAWQQGMCLRQLAAEVSAGHWELERELESPQTLISVNQALVRWDHPIEDGDEVAFLPPVTGG